MNNNKPTHDDLKRMKSDIELLEQHVNERMNEVMNNNMKIKESNEELAKYNLGILISSVGNCSKLIIELNDKYKTYVKALESLIPSVSIIER